MWNHKNYSLPRDLGILTELFSCILLYSLLIRFKPLPRIIRDTASRYKQSAPRHKNGGDQNLLLNKAWYACNFFLRALGAYDRPCLVRTLALYRFCLRRSIQAEVIIGVNKNTRTLISHSWLLINGVAFKEKPNDLGQYAVILEGRSFTQSSLS